MARTAITPQAITDDGLEATYEAANVDGNSIPGDGDHIIQVINASGGDIVVTAVTGGTFHGEAVADKAVTVTAGEERFIGPFKPALYNQVSDGLVYIDYDGVTSLTIAAFEI
jgi:hypothetical protein